MATATKTARTLQASTSVGAAGSQTSSTWTLTTAFGGVLVCRITNGGTGPTLGCSPAVSVSPDGTNFRTLSAPTAGVTNSAVYDFTFDIPPGVMYVNVVFSGHTGQAVTVEAIGQELTSIS